MQRRKGKMPEALSLLLSTLDEFGEDELKRFKLYLSQPLLEGFPHIPRSQLEHRNVTDVSEKMIHYHGADGALKITLHILRKINRNDLVETLSRVTIGSPDPSPPSPLLTSLAPNSPISLIQSSPETMSRKDQDQPLSSEVLTREDPDPPLSFAVLTREDSGSPASSAVLTREDPDQPLPSVGPTREDPDPSLSSIVLTREDPDLPLSSVEPTREDPDLPLPSVELTRENPDPSLSSTVLTRQDPDLPLPSVELTREDPDKILSPAVLPKEDPDRPLSSAVETTEGQDPHSSSAPLIGEDPEIKTHNPSGETPATRESDDGSVRRKQTGDLEVLQEGVESQAVRSKSPSERTESLLHTLKTLEKDDFKYFMKGLSRDYPECFKSQLDDDDAVGLIDKIIKSSSEDSALKIKLYILETMNHIHLIDSLERPFEGEKPLTRVTEQFKQIMMKRFQSVPDGFEKKGNPTPLNSIHTELYIIDGETEVLQQPATESRSHGPGEIAVSYNDIFKPLPGQDKHIRSVLTQGVAGIGKTVCVQKFVLDWAEGKANQDFDFVFVIPLCGLTVIEDNEYSLLGLVTHFYPEIKECGDVHLNNCKVLFIFDGLNDRCHPFQFQATFFGEAQEMCDETQISSVPEILINLIKGNLLPSALLWITSRPEAAHQIPPDFICRVTEIRGFNESQKEEYFKKRFADDENQACEILSSLKSSRSLYSMCHIPVFCWITATVLEQMLREAGSREIPKTLTEMYTQFLLIQINPTTETHCDKCENRAKRQTKSNIKSVLKLGRLAFQHLEMREVIIDKNSLRKQHTDISQGSVCSALCRDMLQGHSGIAQGKVHSFIHPSLHHFLAALYVIFSYSNDKRNLLDQTLMGRVSQLFKGVTLFEVHKSAVNRALKRKDKHLDLFLRFLLGISSYSNGTPLLGLLRLPELGSESIDETIRYITKAIKKSPSPEGSSCLLQCLIEMKNCFHAGEATGHQGARDQKGQELAPASMPLLGEFELRRYIRSDEELLTFLGMVQCTRRALLHRCNLTEKCCKALATAMGSELRELDLSDNDLQDTGVILLSTGLGENCCELEILSLKRCKLTDKCCEALASALISNPSHLRELHLSGNDLLDSGVKLLSAGLGNPHCKLETLGLSGCRITETGCASLASALRSNPLYLRELDLSYNHPGDSGVRVLSAGVEDPSFKLEKLSVDHAGECRVSSGLWKYACELTLDPNTAHRKLSLSEGNRRATLTKEQAYPDHHGRFEALTQVLCGEGQSGNCCYWEVEWSGTKAVVGAAYNDIERKTGSEDARLGHNGKSWSLKCSPDKCFAWHNNKCTKINFLGSHFSRRMGVYLDWPAGTLSFFSVLSHEQTHLHTFRTTFTEPLYPGFRVYSGSVTLSPIP